ncbi:CRISPR-associated helicase Cas3' [Xylanivirga thermophila]|jgi:CRISPR-associated endonuclease/helicase Cas3|uniref:CRISPR-associated helicase Cas3' n=1 Tax=Xylanivirga thermophila TaxID=2496273 RepID=UPI00101BD351|nr:CRISPR-associated helicase Cas3' [Xylanivirga thermophila]
MYKLLDMNNIMDDHTIWAHTSNNKASETLGEHSRLCLDYYNKYSKAKGIDSIVLNTISACGCNDEETKFIYDMFVNAIYLHDIGKINPYFQNRRLKNPKYKKADYDGNSNHALPSAYIYLCEYMPLIEGENKKKFSFFLFSFGYCISKHHGYLKNTDGFCDDITYCMVEEYYDKKLDLNTNSIMTTDKRYAKLKKYIPNEIAFYTLCKLLFALITACDYCATAEYKGGTNLDISIIENIDKLLNNYQNGDIYKGIMQYKENKDFFKSTPINALRSDMFFEAYNNLKENPNGNIYYLEAPTGSGKTNISINLMLNIIKDNPEINNAFYIFPFNTLVEQTANTLMKYFKKDEDFVIVNSVTPIAIKKDNDLEEIDYEYSYLERILNNYSIVVTSHINFFNALFGCGKEQVFPLLKLCNSVVIIDEIQSYKNSIWRHIIIFLNTYAKLLNIKIIIMSATLPKLDRMLDDGKGNFIDLIYDKKKYYQNPLFKDRVQIDLSLLQYKKIDLEYLADKVLQFKDKKVLVEFISKKTAREFYDLLNLQADVSDLRIVELTGDDNAKIRRKMLDEIKNSNNIIVVATQVIEAGVDIDMDIGFKDISTPDAEEQFLGRINRSCIKTGSVAYFFNYDDAFKIYRGDIRINYSITDEGIAKMLQDKDFEGIYSRVLSDLKDETDQLNGKNIKKLFESCLKLRFDEIAKKMRLIEGSKQIFIAYEMKTDEGVINGRDIWNRYKELCQTKEMGYAEKKVNISLMHEEMSYFTYTIYGMENMELRCDDEFGGYYYIEDGEQFIKNGKFDRDAFSKSTRGIFW